MSVENVEKLLGGLIAEDSKSWYEFDIRHPISGIEESQAKLIQNSFQKLRLKSTEQPVHQAIEAKLLLHGWGIEKNLSQAFDKFTSAAKSGLTVAQFNLGNCYFYGHGVAQDQKMAFSFYQQAAQNKYVPALYKLAECYYYGEGVEGSRDEVTRIYDQIAELADADINFDLAKSYEKGHYEAGIVVDRDLKKSAFFYLKAANQGHASAQYHYALCLLHGRGVERDFDEAVYYLNRAVRQNYPEAFFELGKIYLKGKKVKTDIDKALDYFYQAANLKNESACFYLANCFDNDKSLDVDARLASYYHFKTYLLGGSLFSLERLEAMATDTNADCSRPQAFLICIYSLGIHTEVDMAKAASYHCKASRDALFQILIKYTDDFVDYDKTMNNLASLIVSKTESNLCLSWMPDNIQNKIFSGLIKISRDHLRTNHDDYSRDFQCLVKMANQGIVGAEKVLDEWLDYTAKRLSRLITEQRGDLSNHLTVLQQIVGDGCDKAKIILDDYYKKIADRLLEQALNKDAQALLGLTELALKHPAARTALGQYYLARGDKRAAQKHHAFALFKKSDEYYYKKANGCFVSAAREEYGLALYQYGQSYAKGVAIEKSQLNALYCFYKAGHLGYMTEGLSALSKYSDHKDHKLSITSLIFQAILIEKKPHFLTNKCLKKAYQIDRAVFVHQVLKIVSGTEIENEKRLALLNAVLVMDIDKVGRAKIEEHMKILIYKQIDEMGLKIGSMMNCRAEAGFMEWIKYVNTKLFISRALVVASDFRNYSFHFRGFLLLVARRKAEIKKLDTKKIDAYLADYLSSKEEMEPLEKMVNSELPLKKIGTAVSEQNEAYDQERGRINSI